MKSVKLDKYIDAIKKTSLIRKNGQVKRVIGLIIESLGPAVSIGELCYVYPSSDSEPIFAEVVGFRENIVLLMPLGEMFGIKPGSEVVATGQPFTICVGDFLLGRVLDGLGNFIDGLPKPKAKTFKPVHANPPNPLLRKRIKEPFVTGIRVIDGLLTCGKGQRVGIFAGSGVGKSVLLGMIARESEADVNVIALIGERGREVKEFIDRDLGEEGLKRSVLIVCTSDQPALSRLNGAFIATTIAEYFREEGKNVLLMMDSVTRFAMAQREIGLAVGEPPTTKGYTPSVFAYLPRLLERSGNSQNGSITALYTVLVEGDDMNEPVADTVRGILDGHIVLSRALAAKNHYPAIDVLFSVSRIMTEVVTPEHKSAAQKVMQLLATYKEAEDLINIGAYVKGSNREIDEAIEKIDKINKFLRQGINEKSSFQETVKLLTEIK